MTKKVGFSRVLLSISIFVILECISLILISNNGIVQKYRIMGSIRNVQSYFWEKGENIRYFVNLRSINNDLVSENTDLRNKLSLYSSTIAKEDSITSTADFTFISASIIKNSVNKQNNYIIVDKGANDGIKEGMGVISNNGIAGIVSSVTDNYAYIISFLNKNQSISARINTNNTFGPMVWDGKSSNRAVLTEIPMHIKINVGDTVSTSGFSAIFPPNISLGTISSFDNSDGVSQNVYIQLFQDFNQLRSLYIVINNNKEELSQLESSIKPL